MSKLYRFAGPARRLAVWHRTVVQCTGRESTGPVEELWEDGTVNYHIDVVLSPFDVVILLPVWRAERWARHIYKEN